MHPLYMVHYFFYRPFHLTFLVYGSWFQCFGFISEPRISTFRRSHLQFWILVANGSWGWLSLPCGDPSHCCLFLTFPFYVFLVIWFLRLIFVKLVLWPLVPYLVQQQKGITDDCSHSFWISLILLQ